jgi:hypothetical protein
MVAIFFANIFKVQVVNAHACPQFLAIDLEDILLDSRI